MSPRSAAGGRIDQSRPESGWYVVLMVAAGLIVVVGLIRPAWAPRLALICSILAATFIAGSWLRSVLRRTEAETRSVEVESGPGTAEDGSDDDLIAATADGAEAETGNEIETGNGIQSGNGIETGTRGVGSKGRPLAVAELREARGPIGLSQKGMQYLRFVASEQLWTRYRLNLVHEPHWPEIRSRVSPELWLAINYQLPPTGGYHHQDQLNRLLTEIERI